MNDHRSVAETSEYGLPRDTNAPSIPKIIAIELAKASPKFVIAAFVILGLAMLRQPITTFLERSTEIGFGPVTLKAAEIRLKQVSLKGVEPGSFTSEQIATLTTRYGQVLDGDRHVGVLWVDDDPRNNADLVDFLDVIGVNVVIARSYPEAIARLQERSFNAVVSDWSRPADAVEQRARATSAQFWGSGAILAQTLERNGCARHVILYSSGWKDDMPIPPGVLAQTNDYYSLMLLIADKLRHESGRCRVVTG